MALWHLEGSLDETGRVQKIPIDKSPFIIGRSKSLDMVILRSGISREHAELINREGRLFLRDLQSTNGTFVNKQRINSEVLLTHNAVIHFAQFDFRLVDAEHRASADEMCTVVMSIDKVRELQNKSSKEIEEPSAKSKEARPSTPRQKRPVKQPAVPKDTNSAKDSSTPSAAPSQPAVSSDPAANPAQGQPSPRQEDGNIFVQGSGDYVNRRMQPRREVRWPALITFKNQQTLQCVTKDISEIGLGIKSPINIKENTLVNVKVNVFYKGRTREINVIGIVKHSLITTDEFIIGILIKSYSKNSAKFISQFSNHEL